MEILISTIVLIITLYIALYFYWKDKFKYFEIRNIPHRKPIIPFGNLLGFLFFKGNPANYFATLYNEFDAPCVGFYAMTKPYLIVKDPELINRILIKDFKSFTNRSFYANPEIENVMSNSLLAAKDIQWKELRRKLSPVFSSGKLKLMLPLMVECGKNLENYFSNNLNRNLEVKEVTSKYTTDIVATCAFGLKVDIFDKDTEFRRYGSAIFPATGLQALRPISYIFVPKIVEIFKYPFFKKTVTDFFRKVFSDAMKHRKLSKIRRNDLVDILNDIKSEEDSNDIAKFSDEVIFAQAFIFFAAGHETASSIFSFTLHELCVNPDIQQKLREDILKEIEKCGELTYEAVQNMTYLQMVVSETLRKYPLTPMINRECVRDYKIPGSNCTIGKGLPIIISQMALHKDPKYFPNPQTYDPERFNAENKHNIPHYVYLPFGDGPRNCIGERFGLLSVKLGLIHVLQKFKLVPNSNTDEQLEFARLPVLRAKHGINLTLQKL